MKPSITEQVIVIVNAKLCIWSDDNTGPLHEQQNLGIIQWINDIICRIEYECQLRTAICEICFCSVTRQISELHHIAGQKHHFAKITACKSCHRELSLNQYLWDKRWLHARLSQGLVTAFFLLGLHDILVLKAEKTGNRRYKTLAKLLVPEISQLLEQN